MLVLTRRLDESVVITAPDGTQVRVRVVKIGGKVRLGIDAPRDWRISRAQPPAEKTETR